MKLTREQKIRITCFSHLHPQVSKKDLAFLFNVSRKTISVAINTHGFVNHKMGRAYIYNRTRDIIDAEYNHDLEPF